MDDLDGSAAAAFEAIYTMRTGERCHGDVHRRTRRLPYGRDLPNAKPGLYRLTAREARQINWDNAASDIDWSFYRLFAHPALKD